MTCSSNEERRHGLGVRGSCRGWANTPLTALARIRVERPHGRHPSFRRPCSCEETKPSETAPSSSSPPPVTGSALSELSDQRRAVAAVQPANLGGWHTGGHRSLHRRRRPTFAQRTVEPARILFLAIRSACGIATARAGHEAADRQIRKRTFEYSRFARQHQRTSMPKTLPQPICLLSGDTRGVTVRHSFGTRLTFADAVST